ncbi:hypothetical protein [Kistimonas asteriae]|uniref:hypothetical protein n=1 Tax=Kistimonas asteriae TaxID=517724 RepID=UPI001BAD133F|nr:hypothetical protein [Kistimonas asteriae]
MEGVQQVGSLPVATGSKKRKRDEDESKKQHFTRSTFGSSEQSLDTRGVQVTTGRSVAGGIPSHMQSRYPDNFDWAKHSYLAKYVDYENYSQVSFLVRNPDEWNKYKKFKEMMGALCQSDFYLFSKEHNEVSDKIFEKKDVYEWLLFVKEKAAKQDKNNPDLNDLFLEVRVHSVFYDAYHEAKSEAEKAEEKPKSADCVFDWKRLGENIVADEDVALGKERLFGSVLPSGEESDLSDRDVAMKKKKKKSASYWKNKHDSLKINYCFLKAERDRLSQTVDEYKVKMRKIKNIVKDD